MAQSSNVANAYHGWGHWLMHAPCAHQTKKDRLQEVHVCGGEAGQQMLVQEAASA